MDLEEEWEQLEDLKWELEAIAESSLLRGPRSFISEALLDLTEELDDMLTDLQTEIDDAKEEEN